MIRRYRKWRLTRLIWSGKISINEARARLGLPPFNPQEIGQWPAGRSH